MTSSFLLRAYKVKPVKDNYLSDMLEIGRILIEDQNLKPWKKVQGYELFLGPLPPTRHYVKGTVMIAVQREDRVVASFMFEPLQEKFEPIKSLLLKRYGAVYTPHVALDPAFRGKGLALLVYTAMILGGACLWTRKHTKDAAELWKRVARQSGVSMVAVGPLGKVKYPEYAGVADGMLLGPTSLLKSSPEESP